ncbi:primosomal protein N' [Camelimonas fluminis]|uniref:Replication restart protein PriA n=1 Tax=Camelimonas fluminis TaxID=1576911 RepID=A0ABV7ULK5_9HYPH|nr:primosomal protein N' [Camelimonas fluminis]GHE55106.1 primosomal protein N' [Camelimonas fluminis]
MMNADDLDRKPKPSDDDGAPAGAAIIVDVLAPLALDMVWSYLAPPELALAAGDIVRIPFGSREVIGVVWAVRSPGAIASDRKLKTVSGKYDAPPLPDGLRTLLDWIARYTLAPRGQVLRLALRHPEKLPPEAPRVAVAATGKLPARLTPARRRVLAALAGHREMSRKALAEAAEVSLTVINGLIDDGCLETHVLLDAPPLAPDPDFAPATLSDGQTAAAASLRAAVADRQFGVTLIEGVTGSGKTEVYFEAIAEALRQGWQALVMMPEIALTAQFLDRFAARFGVRPAEWHSGVSPRQRERIHAGVASGDIQVVAGARSALFLPFSKLGLLIVDEEHETAYKQEDGVHYHARDMAVVRGRIESCHVALASATPSIESRVNAMRGRYGHLRLPERYGQRAMPRLSAIDLRKQPPPKGRWLSEPLIEAARETLARDEQALFYLNRRGYAPLTLCRSCGHRFQCPNCSASLVEHRFRRALICHHCGHTERRPDACPACGEVDALVPAGPGVERLAEEVAGLFPGVPAITLSSDLAGGSERMRKELDAVAAGEFRIIIGTQLVAKGHNFPRLTLVGVVDADVGLATGDPRGAERTFQMLQQVTGRAGRGDAPGRAILQTHQPDHPVMMALLSGQSEQFYAEEIGAREAAGLAPFGRLAAVIVAGPDRHAAETHAQALARAAHAMPDVSGDIIVLGPAEAPLAIVRGMHRFRLLVKCARHTDLQGFLRAVLAAAPNPAARMRVTVDVDPQSFF